MRKILLSFLITLLFCCTGCNSLFFYPSKQLRDNPIAQQFAPKDITFKSSDGTMLHGWFFDRGPDARGTILMLHGNAQNLSTHVNGVLWLVKGGFNLFIFDYRGYGMSEGSPTIPGVHLDAEAALETVLSMPQTAGKQIIVLGQSIGGAIAIYTVANTPYKDRIAALVTESAFADYRLIVRDKAADNCLTWPLQYPVSIFFNDDYSPEKWIKKVAPVPILILHGVQDPVVPIYHGRRLYEEALQPKLFWETTEPGHIMSFADAEVRERLVRYLDSRLESNYQQLQK